MVEADASLTVKVKTQGEKFESIAFTFCKAATIILLTQKFALPVASGAAAIFYALSFATGKHDTRCMLMFPPLIAGFWAFVCAISSWFLIDPHALPLVRSFAVPLM